MNEKEFIKICTESASMLEAAKRLNLPFTTFKKLAISFGIYAPNQGGKGIQKSERSPLTVKGLNENEFPNYQSFKLKNWLIKHGIKENKCEICGCSEWNGKPINCQLHHKDGNKHNNALDNLQMLCPNCHSQTETFTAKNKKKKYNINENAALA